MNKFFVLAVLIGSMALAAHQAKAATFAPGDLIKASGPAVYYYSANGKRFVFPTEKTFKTWYTDFSAVKTISDTELAGIGIGGNVTYRPGVKLIKITTDPRVYAVSTFGTLRHVGSESIASALYGPDWAKKVDDLPDPFFVNYKLGSEITSTTGFSPSEVTALATSIDVDKQQAPTTPTCTTNCNTSTSTAQDFTLNFNISKTTASPGDVLTLSVATVDTSGTKLIKLLFDNVLATTCEYTNSCSGEIVVPLVPNKSVYEAKAVAVSIKNNFEKTSVLNVTVDQSSQSGHVSMLLDRTAVKNGQSTGITLQTDNTIAVKRMDIYVNNEDIKVCESGIRICQWSQIYTGSVGTTFKIYGIVQDTVGRTYRSPDYQIMIAENDAPYVTFLSGKSTLNAGETVDMTVSGSDENGMKSYEILDQDKKVLKHCDGASPCTYVTGPLTSGVKTFYAKAWDLLDAVTETYLQVTVN